MSNITQVRRVLRDAQRSREEYTLEDYAWLVDELQKMLSETDASKQPPALDIPVQFPAGRGTLFKEEGK